MKFTYAEEQQGTWNPENHSYQNPVTQAGWIKNDAKITLTNHSNAELTANFSFAATNDTYTGTFTKDSMTLLTAEGTAYESAPSAENTFTIGGAMTAESAETLGTISIQLSAPGVSGGTDVTDIQKLKDVFANGGTANLCGDTLMKNGLVNGTAVTLNLRNYTFESLGVSIQNGGSLTVYGENGIWNVQGAAATVGGAGCGISNRGGAVRLEGGTYKASNSQYELIMSMAGTTTINGGMFVSEAKPSVSCSGGSVIINGGTITCTKTQSDDGAIYCSDGSITVNGGSFRGNPAVKVSGTGTVYINGGSFNGALTYFTGTEETAHIIITGGTFTQDPSEFVDTEVYQVTQNTDGTYKVSAKE